MPLTQEDRIAAWWVYAKKTKNTQLMDRIKNLTEDMRPVHHDYGELTPQAVDYYNKIEARHQSQLVTEALHHATQPLWVDHYLGYRVNLSANRDGFYLLDEIQEENTFVKKDMVDSGGSTLSAHTVEMTIKRLAWNEGRPKYIEDFVQEEEWTL